MQSSRFLMTKNSQKTPLNLDEYETYSIDHKYSAYIVSFTNLTDQDCDNLEYEYVSKGFKVFHSEVSRGNQGLLNMTLIIAKLEVVF